MRKSHALTLPLSLPAGSASDLHHHSIYHDLVLFLLHHNSYFCLENKEMGRQWIGLKAPRFRCYPFNRTSSMAKAFLPQSLHDAIAIPLMKSAFVIDIACLQLGHLYCLVDFISATRQNPAPWPECFETLLRVRFLSLYPFCILYRGQSKPLLSFCVV